MPYPPGAKSRCLTCSAGTLCNDAVFLYSFILTMSMFIVLDRLLGPLLSFRYLSSRCTVRIRSRQVFPQRVSLWLLSCSGRYDGFFPSCSKRPPGTFERTFHDILRKDFWSPNDISLWTRLWSSRFSTTFHILEYKSWWSDHRAIILPGISFWLLALARTGMIVMLETSSRPMSEDVWWHFAWKTFVKCKMTSPRKGQNWFSNLVSRSLFYSLDSAVTCARQLFSHMIETPSGQFQRKFDDSVWKSLRRVRWHPPICT